MPAEGRQFAGIWEPRPGCCRRHRWIFRSSRKRQGRIIARHSLPAPRYVSTSRLPPASAPFCAMAILAFPRPERQSRDNASTSTGAHTRAKWKTLAVPMLPADRARKGPCSYCSVRYSAARARIAGVFVAMKPRMWRKASAIFRSFSFQGYRLTCAFGASKAVSIAVA